MDFWTEFTNKMFWLVAPLIVSMPFTLVVVLIWGLDAAALFGWAVVGLVFFYAAFCILMDMMGKPGTRWMSSDPIVERVARRIGADS